MIVSYNWLNSYFGNKLPEIDELVRLIILHSFEVEGMHKVGEDYAIEIDVLSNRGHDALGHLGVARDLAVILDRELVMPALSYPLANFSTKDFVSFEIGDTKVVTRGIMRVVRGLNIKESPDWLKERIVTTGQRPINNVVDITNYVAYESVQPVHAYDLDKLAGATKKVRVRYARAGEKVKVLKGGEYELSEKMMVVSDEEKALDIAGIIGGAATCVDENTKNVLVWVGNFDPIYIRKTRKALKLITDATKRYEQGISNELARISMDRTCTLLNDLASGLIAKDEIDIYPVKQALVTVTFKASQLKSLMGVVLPDKEIEAILDRMKRAGYGWVKSSEEYRVSVPSERLDVRELHEIVEEMARMYGYDKIKSRLAPKKDFTPKVHKGFYYNSLIKNLLLEQGFSELYNYVMSNEGELEFENSAVEGMSHMRSNMTPTIKRNLELNIKSIDLLGLEQIRLFELNKVAYLAGEHWALGLGVKSTRAWRGAKDRAVVEETIRQLENKLSAKGDWQITETGAGVVAELNVEKFMQNLQSPNSYGDVLNATSMGKRFKPYSQYPFVLRDIALWTPMSTKLEDVEKIIVSEGAEWLVRITLFDTFTKGEQNSYAFHLVFQSMERTLTDSDVNVVHARITKALNAHSGFSVR
ncbi:MAG TPA: phenylalanine--tRNA ligase subunit beta [Candidatus Paceibacterota bacterium]